MTSQTYISPAPLTQPVSRPLTADFIEQLAQSSGSPNADDLALKTLDAPDVPPPAVISSDCGDVADGPLPSFEAAPVSPDVTGVSLTSDKRGQAIVKKIMRPFFRAHRRTPQPKTFATVKPSVRKIVAQTRARRSPTSHGSARRKAADSGGNGDSDGSSRRSQLRWTHLRSYRGKPVARLSYSPAAFGSGPIQIAERRDGSKLFAKIGRPIITFDDGGDRSETLYEILSFEPVRS
jgi:hypothetical protein